MFQKIINNILDNIRLSSRQWTVPIVWFSQIWAGRPLPPLFSGDGRRWDRVRVPFACTEVARVCRVGCFCPSVAFGFVLFGVMPSLVSLLAWLPVIFLYAGAWPFLLCNEDPWRILCRDVAGQGCFNKEEFFGSRGSLSISPSWCRFPKTSPGILRRKKLLESRLRRLVKLGMVVEWRRRISAARFGTWWAVGCFPADVLHRF
jgi:hypothetical protein